MEGNVLDAWNGQGDLAGEVQVAPRPCHFTAGVVFLFSLSKIRFKAHSVSVGTRAMAILSFLRVSKLETFFCLCT